MGAVPPLVGVAVKVKLLFAQVGLLPLVIAICTEATAAGTASLMVTLLATL